MTVELQSSVTIGGRAVSSGSRWAVFNQPLLGLGLVQNESSLLFTGSFTPSTAGALEWKSAIVKIIDWLDLESRANI